MLWPTEAGGIVNSLNEPMDVNAKSKVIKDYDDTTLKI